MRHRGRNSVFYIQYNTNKLCDDNSISLSNESLNCIDFRIRKHAGWVGDTFVFDNVIKDEYLFDNSLISTLREEAKSFVYHIKISNRYEENLESTCSKLKAPFIKKQVKHT